MNKSKISISYFLFYVALFFAEVGWMFVNVNVLNNYCGFFIDVSVCILLLCCVIQSKKYSIKSIIFIVFLITFFMINSFIINDKRLLLLLLFCLSCRNLKFDKIINFNWKLQLILIIIVLILYNLNLTDNYYMYRMNGAIRSSMGFSHPNAFGVYVFSTFCQYVYSKHNNIKLLYLFILALVLSLGILKFADSRGSAYSLMIVFFFVLYIKNKDKRNNYSRFLRNLLVIFPTTLIILSFCISYGYNRNNKLMYNANLRLSGRISASHYIVNNYDVKMFGQKLDLVSTKDAIRLGKNALVLDNAYLKLLYQYGLIPTILFIVLYSISIKKAIVKKDSLLVCMLIIYAIRGLTENVLFNLYGNIFLLIFAMIIYGDDFYVNESKE